MMDRLEQCLNCQQDLLNSEKFCHNCGQKNHATRLTLRSLLNDLVNAIFNVDARLWVTLKTGFLKIGTLVKEFNAGKRKKYVAPVQFYLFCSLIYFVFLGFDNNYYYSDVDTKIREHVLSDTMTIGTGFSRMKVPLETFKALPDFSNQQIDSLLQQENVPVNFFNRVVVRQGTKMILSGNLNNFAQQLSSFFSTGMFLLMPIFGWLLYLFFHRIYPYYIEHLIFSIYFHSIAFLILSLYLIIPLITGIISLKVVFMLALFIFLLIALKQFYQFTWLKTIGYFILLNLVYNSILLVFTLGIIIISLIFT